MHSRTLLQSMTLLALQAGAISSFPDQTTAHAPDIIEAILRGDEPDGLSLEKLRKPALSLSKGTCRCGGMSRGRDCGLTGHA
jgi:hypothetical protein